MIQVALRKAGGAHIVSIPKAVLEQFDLHAGMLMDLSVENNRIILSPIPVETTLEDLLAGSPKELLTLTEEDREWLTIPGREKEFF